MIYYTHNSFWGFEQENYVATSTIGAAKKNQLIKRFLDIYKNRHFIKGNGEIDGITNVALVTQLLEEYGLKRNGNIKKLTKWG